MRRMRPAEPRPALVERGSACYIPPCDDGINLSLPTSRLQNPAETGSGKKGASRCSTSGAFFIF